MIGILQKPSELSNLIENFIKDSVHTKTMNDYNKIFNIFVVLWIFSFIYTIAVILMLYTYKEKCLKMWLFWLIILINSLPTFGLFFVEYNNRKPFYDYEEKLNEYSLFWVHIISLELYEHLIENSTSWVFDWYGVCGMIFLTIMPGNFVLLLIVWFAGMYRSKTNYLAIIAELENHIKPENINTFINNIKGVIDDFEKNNLKPMSLMDLVSYKNSQKWHDALCAVASGVSMKNMSY